MSELNPQDRQALDKVLAKPVTELTESDRALLRARRTYLTRAERETYLGQYTEGGEAGDDAGGTGGDTGSNTGASSGNSVDYTALSRPELVALAKNRGVKASGKSEEIIARLEAQDAESGEEKEE